MKTSRSIYLIAAAACLTANGRRATWSAPATSSARRARQRLPRRRSPGSGDVIVTQGDTEGLVIEAEDNLLPLIESTVEATASCTSGSRSTRGQRRTHQEDVVYKLAAKTLDQMVRRGFRQHPRGRAGDRRLRKCPCPVRARSAWATSRATAVNVESGRLRRREAGRRIRPAGRAIDGSGDLQPARLKTARPRWKSTARARLR